MTVQLLLTVFPQKNNELKVKTRGSCIMESVRGGGPRRSFFFFFKGKRMHESGRTERDRESLKQAP